MRKYILPSALILACFLGAALSQNINRAVQLSQDPTGLVGYDTSNNIYIPGHLNATTRGGPAPVLTACATGGTPGVVGTDFSGQITSGTSASTSCVLTFGTAFVTAPRCVVTWSTGPLAAMSWTTSVTALTITQTSTASVGIAYICTSVS